ncbi:MAG: PAS domain S-box protein, partial [Deltaproteobacteria bacterium]|nr:PAS domain S-box protein [Deltaproteobacteria bacterium]
LYLNGKFVEVFGYTLDDIPHGRDWFKLAFPNSEFRNQAISTWIDDLAGCPPGEPRPREFDAGCKDGRIRRIIFRPVTLSDGNQLITYEDVTDRKAMEEALRQSESNYKLLVENSSEGICVLQDGMIRYANPWAVVLTGYTKEELASLPFLDLVHPEERKAALDNYISRLNGEEVPSAATYRIVTKLGDINWVDLNALLIDWEGKPAILAFLNDITDRKLAEQALGDSEERFKTVFDESPIGIEVHDDQGRLLEVNKSCLNIFGVLDPEEIKGFSLFDNPNLPEDARGTLRRGQAVCLEMLFDFNNINSNNIYRTSKSGQAYIHLVIRPLISKETKNIKGYLVLVRDVTERRRAAEELEWEVTMNAGLARLSSALVSLPADVADIAEMVLDQARILTGSTYGYVSAIEQDTGENTSHALVKMMPDECALPGKERKISFSQGTDGHYPGLWGHSLNIKEAFYTNSPQTHPAAAGLPTGHVLIDKFLSVPVMLGDELVGQISLANPNRDYLNRDLQAIRQLAELFSLAINSHRVQEGRADIENQLRQVQKMEAMGALAGGIAHDFNNILGAIYGYTEIALEDARAGKLDPNDLEQVLLGCKRAKDLIKQILTFSRRTEKKTYPVRLGMVVEEALNLIRASFPTTIEISKHIEAAGGLVMADPTEIHQVIMNLCTNSAHAMRDSWGLLEVKLTEVQLTTKEAVRHPDLTPGSYLKLTVKDTGGGIDPKIIGRIFDPFFTTKKGEGTGMGLSVAHGIIKSYAGAIEVTSGPGSGSTFAVFLPKIEIQAEEAGDVMAQAPRGTERILFIDDEATLVHLWRQILKRLGYQVTAYTDSLEALCLFRDHPDSFDLVITDQTMPIITGLDLAREVLAIRPDMPIILCTGYSESVTSEMAKAAGIQEYILKPLDHLEMANVVRRTLDANQIKI